jgi:hypothetical protein
MFPWCSPEESKRRLERFDELQVHATYRYMARANLAEVERFLQTGVEGPNFPPISPPGEMKTKEMLSPTGESEEPLRSSQRLDRQSHAGKRSAGGHSRLGRRQ